MNHYSQQALGNLLWMLWMGSKVFLDQRISLYAELTYHNLNRIGVIAFLIQKDLTKNNSKVFTLLNKDDQEINWKILQQEVGQEQLFMQLQKDFELLLSES